MISGIPLKWALELKCQILAFMCPESASQAEGAAAATELCREFGRGASKRAGVEFFDGGREDSQRKDTTACTDSHFTGP